MMRTLLLFTFVILSLQSHAEPFQDGFRYGTYGIVAGALAGGTSIALSDDPGSNLAPVARGASLGLYAGILVAVFKNIGDFKEPAFSVQPVSWGQGKDQGLGFSYSLSF